MLFCVTVAIPPLDTVYAAEKLIMQLSRYCMKLTETVHQSLRKISLAK
jgi:hypothetical protein